MELDATEPRPARRDGGRRPDPTLGPHDQLGDFSTDRRVLVLSGMAVAIGAAAALVADALVWLIAVITNLAYYQRFSSHFVSPAGNRLGAWAVLVPVAGGLVIGVMARYGSEKIRGHGIPEALEAILIGRSRLEPKVALLKPVSSAISIGTGGPFGAEGPIIMTGGAVGSLVAQLFHLSSAERKTLLVAGAAAGMAAIFATPMAAVLLAVELVPAAAEVSQAAAPEQGERRPAFDAPTRNRPARTSRCKRGSGPWVREAVGAGYLPVGPDGVSVTFRSTSLPRTASRSRSSARWPGRTTETR
jgi:Voltage gated chloride channel